MSEPIRIQTLNPDELLRFVERLQAQVGELERRNAELRAENERLQRRQHRQAAPFSKDTRVAKPKRPGRKPGQGTFRHREAPTSAWLEDALPVPVVEAACPHCGGELDAEEVELASVTELPARPQPEVRTYRVGVRHCSQCGRSVRGRHPDLAADQYGATAHRGTHAMPHRAGPRRLGPRLLAAGHAVHYGQGVPMRKVPAILASLTGAAVTQGALLQDAQRRAQGAVGQAYEGLRQELRTAERVHTDDTGWRVAGQLAQLMAFTTETTTVYQIRDRHRNQEVREILPADYAGVLCSDRGKSYDARDLRAIRQQKCLCHLQRSITALLETKWGRGRTFGLHLRRLFRGALALWQAERAGTAPDFAAQAAGLQAQLTALLRERPLPDPSNQHLLDDLRGRHAHGDLLRFLADPRIEPTNNRAERALRPAVIARKVSQCSKNQRGADTFAAFASVSRTIVQRGGSLVADLTAVFGGAPLPPARLLPP